MVMTVEYVLKEIPVVHPSRMIQIKKDATDGNSKDDCGLE
jgi:hypothetical protein